MQAGNGPTNLSTRFSHARKKPHTSVQLVTETATVVGVTKMFWLDSCTEVFAICTIVKVLCLHFNHGTWYMLTCDVSTLLALHWTPPPFFSNAIEFLFDFYFEWKSNFSVWLNDGLTVVSISVRYGSLRQQKLFEIFEKNICSLIVHQLSKSW